MIENHEVDRAALQRSMDDTGAVVMGHRLFDIIDDPRGWSDDMGYGADLAGRRRSSWSPTGHRRRCAWGSTSRSDIAAAIDQARAAAGDKAVIVMGGGHVIASASRPTSWTSCGST